MGRFLEASVGMELVGEMEKSPSRPVAPGDRLAENAEVALADDGPFLGPGAVLHRELAPEDRAVARHRNALVRRAFPPQSSRASDQTLSREAEGGTTAGVVVTMRREDGVRRVVEIVLHEGER